MFKTIGESLYSKDPLTCKGDTPLVEVAQIIADHHVGAIIITDEKNRATGIFTERDWINNIAPNPSLDTTKELVKDHMTPDPKCIKLEQRLEYGFGLMRMCEFRHLIIIDDEQQVIGILSIRDAFYFLCEEVEKIQIDSSKV